MFKTLGIIESFGTGIGEAKRAMEENGSPQLYYKTFSESYNVTSVVIPVNEEYLAIKGGSKLEKKMEINFETQVCKEKILHSNYSSKVKRNLLTLYDNLQSTVFGNADVMRILGCSESTATFYLKKLHDELELAAVIHGQGKGKYHFRQEL